MRLQIRLLIASVCKVVHRVKSVSTDSRIEDLLSGKLHYVKKKMEGFVGMELELFQDGDGRHINLMEAT